jgi:hypothetical protein
MIYNCMQWGNTAHIISIISRWHFSQGPRLSLTVIYTKISVHTTRHMTYNICIDLFAFCRTASCTTSSFFLCNCVLYLNINLHPIIITNNNLLYNMSFFALSQSPPPHLWTVILSLSFYFSKINLSEKHVKTTHHDSSCSTRRLPAK